MDKFDFSGWATRNDLKCSDGRIIRKDAFKHCDGQKVPLVWNHQHNEHFNVLGHALLENREEGVYVYGTFNDTESGNNAKILVQHGDVSALSIYANQLQQQGPNVMHGAIREVSLVLAGANPGAYIDSIISHGEESEEEAIIYTGENIEICHAEEKAEETKEDAKSEDDETVADVFNSMSEKQKTVVYAMIGQALSDDEDDVQHSAVSEEKENETSEGGNETMKHNVFDKETQTNENVLSHSETQAIFDDAKRYGSLKDSFLAHTVERAEGDQDYGIIGTDWLFPEDHNLNPTPEFIKRDTGWVSELMGAVHHTPFSRIKSMFADITEEEARAKGYMKKGEYKKEEVFGLLKRSTSPTTIYKKQKMDRDDVVDIADFDVVAWIKREMRLMLDEEIARAILVGDNRPNSSDDKISELNIRPIWKDENLFTIKTKVQVKADADADTRARAIIRSVVKSRKNYKGSGNPTMYTTEDVLTDMLLIEDSNGRVIYDSVDKLKSMLRVGKIVTVPVMEGLTREGEDGEELELAAIIVNPKDYNVGADKGGAINMFDDFDIDYNAMKYLIETRCSGALVKPFSAIAVEIETVSA